MQKTWKKLGKKVWKIITPNNFTYCIPIERNINGE